MQRLCIALTFGFLAAAPVGAADTTPAPGSSTRKAQPAEQIYGSQLMTDAERDAYRTKMRSAKTQAERDQLRTDHHAAMQARAKERGVTLPDTPRTPPRSGAGAGAGAGPGPGQGAGPRAGQGEGPRPGGGPGQGR